MSWRLKNLQMSCKTLTCYIDMPCSVSAMLATPYCEAAIDVTATQTMNDLPPMHSRYVLQYLHTCNSSEYNNWTAISYFPCIRRDDRMLYLHKAITPRCEQVYKEFRSF